MVHPSLASVPAFRRDTAMQLAGMTTVVSLRTSERQLQYGSALRRLWQTMRREWQRSRDRAVANAVNRLDHPGVAEDYRAACRMR
jgi:hypothetical protein